MLPAAAKRLNSAAMQALHGSQQQAVRHALVGRQPQIQHRHHWRIPACSSARVGAHLAAVPAGRFQWSSLQWRPCPASQQLQMFSSVDSSNGSKRTCKPPAAAKDANADSKPDMPMMPPPIRDLAAAPAQIFFSWQRKALGYLRESLLVTWASLIENLLFGAAEALQLDKLLTRLTPKLERWYAQFTGQWYVLKDGRRVPYSIVNAPAPSFEPPPGAYSPPDFPFLPGMAPSRQQGQQLPGSAESTESADLSAQALSDMEAGEVVGWDVRRAHFMALVMKAVYEEPEVVRDLCEARWGCRFLGFYTTSPAEADEAQDSKPGMQDSAAQPAGQQRASQHGASHEQHSGSKGKGSTQAAVGDSIEFLPRTGTFMLATKHALVLSFRGTQPTNLVNIRSSGRISVRAWDKVGRVHSGFYSALMFRSEELGTSLYERLLEAVQEHAADGRPIFMTGHSLGGALAAVFAQALHTEGHDELVRQIGGIWTFGAPRLGDTCFVDALAREYPGRSWRLVHAADIIPKVPPKWLGYCHPPKEVFITSSGRVILDEQQIRRWRRTEAAGYLPIQLWKTVGNALRRRERLPRTISRIGLLLTLPGLSDHFPSDYEMQLRDQLTKAAQSQERQ